jgi:hypothetical protein
VGEVFPKLGGVVEAEEVGVGLLLLLQDALILFLLLVRLEILPGEGTTEEVHQYEPQALHVVSATLFDAEMGIDGRIAGGASQIFTLNERNVATTGVLIFLCQTKIDDMNHVLRGERVRLGGQMMRLTFREPVPIKKLSGLTSRWIYKRECMNSSLEII